MPLPTPSVWMDLTTSLRAGHQTNGTTRVETRLAHELTEILGAQLKFCRYHSSKFVSTPPIVITASSNDPKRPRPKRGPGASNAKARSLGRRFERAIRRSIKRAVGKIQKDLTHDHFPEASEGDCIFLAGENWSSRYDYEVLRSLRVKRKLKIVALCQDLIPVTHPQFFDSSEFVDRYQEYTNFLLSDVDLVVAISHSTAAELEKLKHATEHETPIHVVNPGSDFDPSASSQPPQSYMELTATPFVLSVSTIQSRKNYDLIYRVWRRFAEEGRLDIPGVVIVGQRGFGCDDLLWQIARDPSVKGRIIVLHNASDDELKWLYQNCRFTLYPSFVEGWGLPISESLANGKVCIASNTSSMPEAGQGLSIHIDPINTLGWYECILSLSQNAADLAERELRIQNEYQPKTWHDAAQEIANLLIASRVSK